MDINTYVKNSIFENKFRNTVFHDTPLPSEAAIVHCKFLNKRFLIFIFIDNCKHIIAR